MNQQAPFRVIYQPQSLTLPQETHFFPTQQSTPLFRYKLPSPSKISLAKLNTRPKQYKSSQKVKTFLSILQIPQKPFQKSSKFNISASNIQQKSLNPPNKGQLSQLKEQTSLSNIYSPKNPNTLNKNHKIPTFLSKSPNKKSIPQNHQEVANPEIKKDLKPKRQPSGNQTAKSNRWARMRINGRTQLFKIIKFLDEGSYGKVYLVEHSKTNLIFCLKLIEKSQLLEHNLNQLVREVIIQSSISHPNIVNLYSFSSDAEYVYLLLEPCLDGNLYSLIKQKPLEQKVTRKYIKQVCCALQYLHKKDIIHRDVKPQNVLLHQQSAKICDFGWAVYSPILRNTKCGTPIYTCPEMIKDEAYDSKIDVWCVGVLTYELLTASIPFQINAPRDLIKILQEEVEFPEEVNMSQNAKNFILRCLKKKGAERMSIREALDHVFLNSKQKKYS